MAQTAAAAIWFLPFTLPICFWVAWNDMKFMKIPNLSVAALFFVFAIVGLVALPLPDYLWRYLHLVVVLAVGLVMYALGGVGAGDVKFAAAMAPYIATGDGQTLLYLFAAVLLAAVVTHRLLRRLPALRRLTPDWESWTRRDFPMGLALSGTLAFYLVLGAIYGA